MIKLTVAAVNDYPCFVNPDAVVMVERIQFSSGSPPVITDGSRLTLVDGHVVVVRDFVDDVMALLPSLDERCNSLIQKYTSKPELVK